MKNRKRGLAVVIDRSSLSTPERSGDVAPSQRPPGAERAGLRPLPFHSLRHHFGSVAVNRASLVQVQAWMGHSHIQTTARYLHHRSQASDAALLAEAFASQTVGSGALGAEPTATAR